MKWYLSIVIILVAMACQKQEIKQYPLAFDYSYFPLDSGMWKHYEVTYITIDSASKVYDTVEYQVREVYTAWVLNASNDSMMRMELFNRDSSHHSWKPQSVWQLGINYDEALQIEENVKFVKIKFPAIVNSFWDGNAYNRMDTLKVYDYTITAIDEPESINSLSFDSVLTVTQKEKVTNIDKLHFYEKYAKGIGLVEKQQVDIYSDILGSSLPIEQRVTQGTLYYKKLIDYGKN